MFSEDLYVKISGDRIILGNHNLEFIFDSEGGGIMGILNKQRDLQYLVHEYVEAIGGGPIFSLTFLKEKSTFKAYPLRLEGFRLNEGQNEASLALKYYVRGAEVTCQICIPRWGELSYWRISIENSSALDIVEVTFPLLLGLRIGRNHDDDILVRPNRYGEKISNPVENPFRPVIRYLGSASMMWMDLYDQVGGLYLASYDRSLIMTDLEASSISNFKALKMSLKKYVYIPSGRSWRSELYVVGVHLGDWHWAADQYRRWAESWMEKPNPPKWLLECDGFLEKNLKEEPRLSFKDLPAIYEKAEEIGLNYVVISGQMVGEGCCDRFYYPDPLLGSIDDLKRGIEEIHRRGGYITFYMNGQAFDPRYPRLPEKYDGRIPEDIQIPSWEEFKEYAVMRYDGSLVGQYPIEEYPFSEDRREQFGYPYRFYIMCPACKGWRDYLKYWLLRYVRDYGTDGMMIDQIAADDAKYCFNFRHGHEHHGCWTQGYCQMLREMLHEGKRLSANFCLGWIEGFGDAYGQYAHSHLTHGVQALVAGEEGGSWAQYPHPEVCRYTFPEYITFDGGTLSNCSIKMRKRIINGIFLLGSRFNVYYDEILASNEYAEYVKHAVRLRRKIKPWLRNATFRDTIGLGKMPKDVSAKIFISEHGILVTLDDERKEKKPFTLQINLNEYSFSEIEEVTQYTLESTRRLRFNVDRGCLKIYVDDLNESFPLSAVTVKAKNQR